VLLILVVALVEPPPFAVTLAAPLLLVGPGPPCVLGPGTAALCRVPLPLAMPSAVPFPLPLISPLAFPVLPDELRWLPLSPFALARAAGPAPRPVTLLALPALLWLFPLSLAPLPGLAWPLALDSSLSFALAPAKCPPLLLAFPLPIAPPPPVLAFSLLPPPPPALAPGGRPPSPLPLLPFGLAALLLTPAGVSLPLFPLASGEFPPLLPARLPPSAAPPLRLFALSLALRSLATFPLASAEFPALLLWLFALSLAGLLP
jgi:hypothetical protein